MSSVQSVSAIPPSRNLDAAKAAPGRQQGNPVFSRTPSSGVRTSKVDRSDEAATFGERVRMLFDAKVPAGGLFSRSFAFDVSGVRGKITEIGAGQLYVDFPQRGISMLIMGGVCAPTQNATLADIAAMRMATLLGLST